MRRVGDSIPGGTVDSLDVKRHLTCILSADAVGYSGQMARDEDGTIRVLAAHRAVIDGIVAFHLGWRARPHWRPEVRDEGQRPAGLPLPARGQCALRGIDRHRHARRSSVQHPLCPAMSASSHIATDPGPFGTRRIALARRGSRSVTTACARYMAARLSIRRRHRAGSPTSKATDWKSL
jgi:hypothetical protein